MNYLIVLTLNVPILKALKAFIKPFEAPQRSVKIKIEVNLYFNINYLNAQDGKCYIVLTSY